MFFLRCMFWLSIVYATMSWTPGAFAPADVGSRVAAAGRSQVEALVETAKARATEFCLHNARECIDDAARLTSLVTASERADEPDAQDVETTAAIPLPVPDPRRHVRDAKLARSP